MSESIIIAFESSCDETSVSVVKNGNEILSNVVASQVESHARFGGVVPEVASRHHVDNMLYVIDEAIQQANIAIEDIDAVAVTKGPGLIGALLIGIQAAKSFAFVHNIPLIGVHHIAGHIHSVQFDYKVDYPAIALVISGGHTELVRMARQDHYEVIGDTQDDAIGEAFDKVARVLKLPYPGGPHMDRLAKEGRHRYDLPRPLMNDGTLNFSFSGLKSAVINLVHNCEQRGDKVIASDLAYDYHQAVIDILQKKINLAMEHYPETKSLIVAGGVAQNSHIRQALMESSERYDLNILFSRPSLCGDNAAMIGAAAHIKLINNQFESLSLNGQSQLNIEEETAE